MRLGAARCIGSGCVRGGDASGQAKGLADSLDRQLAGRLTVQIVGEGAADPTRITEALRRLPQVGEAVAVPREELAELVRPWLGDAGLDADLPMPAMIDVTLTDARLRRGDAFSAEPDPALMAVTAEQVSAVAHAIRRR